MSRRTHAFHDLFPCPTSTLRVGVTLAFWAYGLPSAAALNDTQFLHVQQDRLLPSKGGWGGVMRRGFGDDQDAIEVNGGGEP